jgi:hypothetical protein
VPKPAVGRESETHPAFGKGGGNLCRSLYLHLYSRRHVLFHGHATGAPPGEGMMLKAGCAMLSRPTPYALRPTLYALLAVAKRSLGFICVPKRELGNEEQRRGAPVGLPSRGDTQVPPYENWALVASRSHIRANQSLIANPEKKGQGVVTPARLSHRSPRRRLLLP